MPKVETLDAKNRKKGDKFVSPSHFKQNSDCNYGMLLVLGMQLEGSEVIRVRELLAQRLLGEFHIEHTWEHDRQGVHPVNTCASDQNRASECQRCIVSGASEAHCRIETHATGTEDGEPEESLSRDGDKKTGPAPFIFLARFRIWMTTCAPPARGFLSVTHSLNDKLWATWGRLLRTPKQHVLIEGCNSLAHHS